MECPGNRRIVAVFCVMLAGLAVAGCGRKPPQSGAVPATAVEVVRVGRADIADAISVTGTVKALDDVQLSAKISGRAVRVPFREGDRVAKGAVVVQQDTADLQNQVRSADAALKAARVRLSQARTQYRLQDVTSDTSIQQAQKSLESARQQLDMVRQGARPQEREQVENAVRSAEANFENAKLNLDRSKQLFGQGAIPRASLDADQRAYDVARASLDSARASLSLIREGARKEEVRIAENNVREAEERLRQAKASVSLTKVRQEDIQAAQASVSQAEASLAMARQTLADAGIRTPISGVVASRNVEPGEMIGPSGLPLIRVYNPGTLYYEAVISETQIDRVKVGQEVQVRSDSVSGRVFAGRVEKVYPAAQVTNRSFHARISVRVPDAELKPGMFAKGQIVIEERSGVLTIPQDAVITEAGGLVVYVAAKAVVEKADPKQAEKMKRGEKPRMVPQEVTVGRKRRIDIGLASDSSLEVTRGLEEGDLVIRSGQTYLQDGQEVQIVNGSSEKA